MIGMTKAQIQDKIDREHGVAFISYRSASEADAVCEHAKSLGFKASANWSECTGGIEIGAWHVHIWNS